jgi:hypothetical protein
MLPFNQGMVIADIVADLHDLTGMVIGFTGVGFATIRTDLAARGAFPRSLAFPLSAPTLDSLDAFSIDDRIAGANAADIALLRNWVQSGGGLFLQSEASGSAMANVNQLLNGTGITSNSTGGFRNTLVTQIRPHPTTRDVDTINASAYRAYFDVLPPADTIALDELNRPHIAVSRLGAGRVIAVGNQVAFDVNMSVGQTRLFANQAFDWLLSGVPWLDNSPLSGTVEPDSTAMVQIQFHATGLTKGDYHGLVAVLSNDPSAPWMNIPVTLTVFDTALTIAFNGMCPSNTVASTGGALAFQTEAVVDQAVFATFDLVSTRLNGLPAVPFNAPEAVGLDSVDAPLAPQILVFWRPETGETGDWDFCMEATTTTGLAETTCVSFTVVEPGANVVGWQSQHFKFLDGGPFAATLDLNFTTQADSTFAIVGPFDIRSTTPTPAFLTAPIDSGDGIFSEAMSVFEQRFDQNRAFMNNAVSPDSLLIALVDLGGSALPAGLYERAVSYPTTIDTLEGIFEIDTTTLPPNNRLTYVVAAAQEVYPDYTAGCFAVTKARNLPATPRCPVTSDLKAVFGDLVSISGFSFDDPDAGPGPYTFGVVTSKRNGTPATPTQAPSFVGDTFEWQTSALDSNDVGVWEFCVNVHDGERTSLETCCFSVEILLQVPVICFEIGSAETFSDADVCIPLTIANLAGSADQSCKELGGFELLFTYDASVLTFMGLDLVGSILEASGWEYVTYRIVSTQPAKVRIITIADMNNSDQHPTDYCVDGLVANLCFHTSNDRTFGCQSAPVRFWWDDCTDNTASSRDGNTLYVITDPYGGVPWFGGAPLDVPPIPGGGIIDNSDSVQAQLATFEGGISGPPGYPCDNPDPAKPDARPCLYFVNGKIKVKCPGDIDDRGDVNLNALAYEISDAVLYSNYFISGPSVFDINPEGQIAASDVNADGTPLTVSDLVYLIRVITGDAQPIEEDLLGGGPRVTAPVAQVEVSVEHRETGSAIQAQCEYDIGAALLVFQTHDVEILNVEAVGRAVEMDVRFGIEDGHLKVLLYNIEDRARVAAGSGELLRIHTSGPTPMILERVEAATFQGQALSATITETHHVPEAFALHANYPNPFNPTTTFVLDLPVASQYTVHIYNIAGQLVRTMEGYGEAGSYSLTWDGRSDQGSSVASGVYFYKAAAGKFAATRKMLMLK